MKHYQFLLSKSFIHRCVILFASVFCPVCIFAQNDLESVLHKVEDLIGSNPQEARKLLTDIPKDIVEASEDIDQFWYHYFLAATYEIERVDNPAKLEHLLIAKDICETKAGIWNSTYFEVLYAIGKEYKYRDEVDLALIVFEEALVKALPYFSIDDDHMQKNISDLRGAAADIYRKKGFDDIANYIDNEKPLDYVGSFDYACELLSNAMDAFSTGDGKKSIKLLDEAREIFETSGKGGAELLQILYDCYLDSYSLVGDYVKINQIIPYVKELHEQTNTMDSFIDGIEIIISNSIFIHHDIQKTQYYTDYLTKLKPSLTIASQSKVCDIESRLPVYVQAYADLDSLSTDISNRIHGSYEWGISSFRKANLLIQLNREDEAYDICKDIIDNVHNLNDDPERLYWSTLMNLADYTRFHNKYDESLKWLRLMENHIKCYDQSFNEDKGWLSNRFCIVYMNMGKYDEAKKTLDLAESYLIPIYTTNSVEYATLVHNRGRICQLQGDLDIAYDYYQKSCSINRECGQEPNPRTLQYMEEINQQKKVEL